MLRQIAGRPVVGWTVTESDMAASRFLAGNHRQREISCRSGHFTPPAVVQQRRID
jgi:hypothetical protein